MASRSANTAANSRPANARTGRRCGRKSRMRPRPLLAQPAHQRRMVQPDERLDDARVELAAGLRQDLGDGALDRPRLLVRARVGERVEDVRDGDDAPGDGYLLAREAARVAAAVPALVMA